MFPTTSIAIALLALLPFTTASPTIGFVNKTPAPISYLLVNSKNVAVAGGRAPNGSSTALQVPPVNQGYSLRLSKGNPQASSGVLTFEYTLSSDYIIVYDWSALNGNPDPFVAYNRVISPANPSGACFAIQCYPGQQDPRCEAAKDGDGPNGECPAFDGQVLSVQIY